jgi:hypothetical protein
MRITTIAPPPGESLLEKHCYTGVRAWWDANRPGWVDASWWAMPVREELLDLMRLPTGPDHLETLQTIDAGPCAAHHQGEGLPGDPVPGTAPGYPCGCQVVLVAAWRAATDWVAVAAARSLTAAVGADPVVVTAAGGRPGIVDPAREEVAVAMRLVPGSAAAMMRRARALAAHPRAAALAEEGMLPLRTVERVCEAANRLSDEDAVQVVDAWCRQVRHRAEGRKPMNSAAAAKCATRLIVAAPSYTDARERACKGRRVEVWGNDDGTATVAAILPEATAHRIYRRLTAVARGLDDPDCGMDAKRADVFVDFLLGAMLSQASGVEVLVTIPLDSLLGAGEEPGEVPGLGPIPVVAARELAADARWRAVLTDAAGAVVSTAASTYRPGAALARFIRARDPECRMPGCRRPAQDCDIDHAIPWPTGPTSADNLGPLCRRHHVMKTHYGWDLAGGAGQWRTPAGAEVVEAA